MPAVFPMSSSSPRRSALRMPPSVRTLPPASIFVDGMRPLLLIAVLILLSVYMPITCSACKKQWENQRALTLHRRRCGKYAQQVQAACASYVEGRENQGRKKLEDNAKAKAKAKVPEMSCMFVLNKSADIGVAPLSPSAGPSNSSEPLCVANFHILPDTFQDVVPSLEANYCWLKPIAHLIPPAPEPSPSPSPEPTLEPEFYDTRPDRFGVFRRYFARPARDFDQGQSADTPIDAPTIIKPTKKRLGWRNSLPVPQRDATTFRILYRKHTGSNAKSNAEIDCFVHEVLDIDDCNRAHLQGFSMAREERSLDEAILSDESLPAAGKLRRRFSSVMSGRETWRSSVERSPRIHRRNTSSSLATKKRFKDPLTGEDVRIHSELDNCDTFMRAQAKVRANRNPADGPEVEYGAFPIRTYSDVTRLAKYGVALVWPAYAIMGGISQYGGKAGTFTAHRIAYLPSVSPVPFLVSMCSYDRSAADLVQDEYKKVYDISPNEDIICRDGITRRLFPRIFTYSADYPERASLACIKYLAGRQCPRCYMEKDQVVEMGGVEETLFRVSAAVLKSESEVFAAILGAAFDSIPAVHTQSVDAQAFRTLLHVSCAVPCQGLSDDEPIRLDGIRAEDFEMLMGCIFDEEFRASYTLQDKSGRIPDEVDINESEDWFESFGGDACTVFVNPILCYDTKYYGRAWPMALLPWLAILQMADMFIVESARRIAIKGIEAEPDFYCLDTPGRLRLACEAGAVRWVFPICLDYIRRGPDAYGCILWEDISDMGLGAYSYITKARETLQFDLRSAAITPLPPVVTPACLRPTTSLLWASWTVTSRAMHAPSKLAGVKRFSGTLV
ncbi:hypothetical protein NM688_g4455 [Phlebia brevispora]|uniref:Uncharacterized protein n=1 Tax=Phlebia brevispora TaxID=194682 RepID=A0ACC1T2K9_9APHY|nr:hypothetical protein NM688_g4455 [Phlebia brevispora]